METSKDTFLAETGTGSLHNQLPDYRLIISDRDDNSSISRTLLTTRNCIARCSLDTQTGWEVARILTTVDTEEISLQKSGKDLVEIQPSFLVGPERMSPHGLPGFRPIFYLADWLPNGL
ncbi:hypothetical protein KIW84_040093 [Lathyrus oleraceus]|uniref:Uncharacterized protein n=1 Tax=Pisum sativum TaxID=3888 RepID=A0A9D4X923_PEA|nr:hypothetical protein KIW84_040093 [Pisum sativum]